MRSLTGPENDYREILGLPDPEPSLSVAVIMPVYNRVDLLAKTVAGVRAQTYPAELLSVIVADDGSEEDVLAALAPVTAGISLEVVRREHDGYGAGQARNLGAAAAQAEVLVFIDADCVPDRDLVTRHARWHHFADNLVTIGSRHSLDTTEITTEALSTGSIDLRVAAFGTTNPDDEAFRHEDYRRSLHRRAAGQQTGNEVYRSLVSSNFSIRADRFARSGGFADDFRRWGGEDIELGWRLWSAAMFFVPDDQAVCYHQIQTDDLGLEGREASHHLNAGLLSSKIPHSFYRTPVHGPIHEVPKVSWVITAPEDGRDEELFNRLIRHHYLDSEVVFAAPGPGTTLVAEAYSADPRFHIAAASDGDPTGVLTAMRASRGEYVALLHGGAAVDRRLLSRSLRRLEARPRLARLSVGYRVRADERGRSYRSIEDAEDLDEVWGVDGLPVFALVRRREWIKAISATDDLASAWGLLVAQTRGDHLEDDLVTLPAEVPGTEAHARLDGADSSESLARFELRGAVTVGSAVSALSRFAIARIRSRPYRRSRKREDGDTQTPSLRWRPTGPPFERPEPPRVNYVGWTGNNNLGDEAMLDAVEQLLAWGDVGRFERAELLVLGGGTLINRSEYLEVLIRQDSPRMERAVFGTGVANPSYWGQVEPSEGWVQFLDSCVYVGVRGPLSLEILRKWGYGGEAEVVGDPALALEVPDGSLARSGDRVVISPAWTGGELWGGADAPVFEALADTTRRFVAEGREVVMLSCYPGDDRHVFEMMRAAGAPELRYVAGYDDVAAAAHLLGSAGLVVAERLHAAVLAAGAGTPFVAIEYRPKVDDFAQSVGMERFSLRSDRVTAESLQTLTDLLDDDYDAIAEAITDDVTTYRDRLKDASKRIAAEV